MKNENENKQTNNKPYNKPTLKKYGKLADLTQSGGSLNPDTGGGSDPVFSG